MTKKDFNRFLIETIDEIQQQQIDEFLKEFDSFDPKEEKKRLKILTRRLAEMHRHVNTELYDQKSTGSYTRKFWKLKEEIKSIGSKLKRYEENKDLVDVFARTHKKYVFHKHGKII